MHRTSHCGAGALALALTLGSTGFAWGQDAATGGAPGSWLMNYAGARTLGLGGAYVANADDPLGALWNPAGLQRMDRNQLMFENQRLFDDTSVNGFGFAVPGNWLPSFGLSMVSLHSGGFERTDEMNDPLGTFGESENAYLFTLAKGLSPRLSLGTNLKVIQQNVENSSAGGFGVDLGAIYQLTPMLRIGASAANLGGPKITLRSTAESFETEYRGGFALEAFGGRGLVTAQFDQTPSGNHVHAGSEYWIQSSLALRVGYQDQRATGGFSYRFAPQYQLDYGIMDHPLGVSHRVGISYRFGGFFASSQADPEVFSPTGERATTEIRLNAHTKSDADHWSLEVVDKTERVVRRFSGPGLPPPHVEWDGKDETGLPVADGTYTYRLAVQDKVGRMVTSGTRRVQISTSGPQGEVPLVRNP